MTTIDVELHTKNATRWSSGVTYILIPGGEIDRVSVGVCLFFTNVASIKDLEDLFKNKSDTKYLGYIKIAFSQFSWSYVKKGDSMAVLSVAGQDIDAYFNIRVNLVKIGSEKSCYDFTLKNVNITDNIDVEYINERITDNYSFDDLDLFDKELIDAISVFIKNVKEICSVNYTIKSYIINEIENITFKPLETGVVKSE